MSKKVLIKNKDVKISIFKGMPNILLPEISNLYPNMRKIDYKGIDKVIGELNDINYNLVDKRYREIVDDFSTLLGDGVDYSNIKAESLINSQLDDDNTNIETFEDIIKRAKISKISNNNLCDNFEDYCADDYSGTLLLAQSSSLDSYENNLIITTKGYLEVHSPYGVIRKSQYDSNDSLSLVLIPEKDIYQYQLKNGDQISCTCTKIDGNKYMAHKILAINGKKFDKWECFRPVFNAMPSKELKGKVDLDGNLKDAIKRFGLFRGDNVFMYMGAKSNKSQVVNEAIYNLAMVFDKIVYIKPNCKEFEYINDDIVRFSTKFEESAVNQIHTALLGINYAKRLVEQGLNVAVVVDDLNALAVLDSYVKNDMIISKTILSSNKDTSNGSLTLFNVMPYIQENSTVGNMHELFKSVQTLALVFDNEYVNLYDSKRI